MKFGYLNLITSQIDPVHYIKRGDYYYTLTFINSNKVTFIKNTTHALIEFGHGNITDNYTGPFTVSREQISSELYSQLQKTDGYCLVSCEIITDKQDIIDFQKLSIDSNFYYFPDEYIEDILLLKYKILN